MLNWHILYALKTLPNEAVADSGKIHGSVRIGAEVATKWSG